MLIGPLWCPVQVNILPPGSDPNKPDIHPEPAPHPEPVTLNPAPVPEPHVSEVAPTPLPAPNKADIKLPEIEAHEQKLANRAKAEKEEIKKDVKGGFRKAEKKGKEYAKKAEVGGVSTPEDGELATDNGDTRADSSAEGVRGGRVEVGALLGEDQGRCSPSRYSWWSDGCR